MPHIVPARRVASRMRWGRAGRVRSRPAAVLAPSLVPRPGHCWAVAAPRPPGGETTRAPRQTGPRDDGPVPPPASTKCGNADPGRLDHLSPGRGPDRCRACPADPAGPLSIARRKSHLGRGRSGRPAPGGRRPGDRGDRGRHGVRAGPGRRRRGCGGTSTWAPGPVVRRLPCGNIDPLGITVDTPSCEPRDWHGLTRSRRSPGSITSWRRASRGCPAED